MTIAKKIISHWYDVSLRPWHYRDTEDLKKLIVIITMVAERTLKEKHIWWEEEA